MKNYFLFILISLISIACDNAPKPGKELASLIRNSADNTPIKFKLVNSKFERCESAPEGNRGFRKVFTFKNETEIELAAELTPDLKCKERFPENELIAMQGRLLIPGTYAKKSALEGSFQFGGDVPELAGTGAFKVSGMTLKISPSPDLTNPDIYLYLE